MVRTSHGLPVCIYILISSSHKGTTSGVDFAGWLLGLRALRRSPTSLLTGLNVAQQLSLNETNELHYATSEAKCKNETKTFCLLLLKSC